MDADDPEPYIGQARVYRWFDDRLDIKAIQTDISRKYVPPNVNIFCIVFARWFILQVATGLRWPLRSLMGGSSALCIGGRLHSWLRLWSSHVFRVYLNWWVQEPLVTGVPDALPIVGHLLVTLLRGGASVGQGTLSRFYTVHTLVLPLLATSALLVHTVFFSGMRIPVKPSVYSADTMLRTGKDPKCFMTCTLSFPLFSTRSFSCPSSQRTSVSMALFTSVGVTNSTGH